MVNPKPGFLDYVESLGFLAEDKILNEDGKHTKIVFDTTVLFMAHKRRMMKEQPQAYTGGSYLWLADTVTKVVNNLRRHKLEPVVLALNIEMHTYVTEDLREFAPLLDQVRNLQKNCLYIRQFPLRHLVIAAALQELQVEVLVSDGGRQLSLATIANELGCPILSMYPRSLLYALRGGVKLIGEAGHWAELSRLFNTGEDILVREWNFRDFLDYHGITTDDFALIAATDELCKTGMEDKEQRPRVFYERLLESVKEMLPDEDKIGILVSCGTADIKDAKLYFNKSLKKYQSVSEAGSESATLNDGGESNRREQVSMIEYLRSSEFKPDTKTRKLLPPGYQERMRRNLFPVSFWSMLATRVTHLCISEEHPDMVSAELCSRRIRQFSYAILFNFDGPPSGEEYFLNDGKYQCFPTETDGLTDVALDKIPVLTVDERRAVLFKALDVDPANERDVLSSKTPLLTAVIQYWVKHCQPSQVHQGAIDVWTQFDDLRDKYRRAGYRTPSHRSCSSQERRELLHPFAQLSAILHDAVELSRLLLDPCGDVQIEEVFDVPYLLHIVLQK